MKIGAYIVIVFVLLAALTGFVWVECFSKLSTGCVILRRYQSPDGRKEADIVEQDPGALGDVSEAIFIFDQPAADHFRLTAVPKNRVLVSPQATNLIIKWESAQRLLVHCDTTDVSSVKSMDRFGDIEIVCSFNTHQQ